MESQSRTQEGGYRRLPQLATDDSCNASRSTALPGARPCRRRATGPRKAHTTSRQTTVGIGYGRRSLQSTDRTAYDRAIPHSRAPSGGFPDLPALGRSLPRSAGIASTPEPSSAETSIQRCQGSVSPLASTPTEDDTALNRGLPVRNFQGKNGSGLGRRGRGRGPTGGVPSLAALLMLPDGFHLLARGLHDGRIHGL